MWTASILSIIVCFLQLDGSSGFSGAMNVARGSTLLLSGVGANEDWPAEKKVFILGLGYVGCALARSLQDSGWEVSGTCTNLEKLRGLQASGIDAHMFDAGASMPLQGDGLAALKASPYVLSTVPPLTDVRMQTEAQGQGQGHGQGQGVADAVLVGLAQELRMSAMDGKLVWLGYLSSTGVYGDQRGAWVDEQTTISPGGSDTAVRRARAESEWRKLHSRSGLPVHTFRLSGIYGPGRSALDTIQKCGGDLDAAGAEDGLFISRIHVDDICRVLSASMYRPNPGMLVNVADDLPSTRYDVLAFAARLLNFPLQPPSRMGYQSRGGSKRVDNAAVRALLAAQGLCLQYPDYRAGLTAISQDLCTDPRTLFRTDDRNTQERNGAALADVSSAEKSLPKSNPDSRLDALEHRFNEMEKAFLLLVDKLSSDT